MPYACPNPGCKGVYNIDAVEQAGRRFNCQNCGEELVIEPSGLHLASGARTLSQRRVTPPPVMHSPDPVPPTIAPDPGPPRPSRWKNYVAGLRSHPSMQYVGGQVRSDWPTFLFGAGAFLVIVFLFFPLLDQAKVARRTAQISAGDKEQDRLDEELALQRKQAKELTVEKRDAEDKQRREERGVWEKDKLDLQKRLDDAQVGFRLSNYWYLWGMLLGFLMLAAAALGYLHPEQPPIRRVVGAVVLCGQMLLIFVAFVIASVGGTR